ncbi:Zcf27p [Elasticomyces elasticus]|uniref:GAL4-like Zn(II)2Cys6 (Or C6 zinc) binuclear cluster DNA-binding domain n=1 Tax=Exophiala sideris TaxID=1016849 RepID=A0ABR0JG65_9EURO|nr:Zcf27p [Elasticomyces elasticus]KAK5025666.1 GAL4-like Zn(II)2Cys6 (or C6 zinc) binuclear cluster DNA-binding domain [Exophiala sideris]KAK5033125.1 Zcf27p [Exophiala sideris]KAK5063610.1 GAL4-like Zn(II)2Cys6 (or C6 zinc) binuclear cluster DNA-binding domain [Exophiala sideris]KAK5180557.1 GAL4-like Zn(II)2Cys6 (or C6 zinc) binuclear cluster DNA-binding domain [Eurotiomycetes sp. CCFEE 6388]
MFVLFVNCFDSASLAILEKLNTIEELLKGPNERRSTTVTPGSVESDARGTLSRLKSLNSPSLERAKDTAPFHMNIEGVLSWAVFDDLSPNLDLKGLLNSTNQAAPPYLSVGTEFDEQIGEETLVARFMNNVFIYNPVLEEAKLHRYMRDARFNGIGWDAQSCLLLLIYAHGSIVGPFDGGHQPDASSFRSTPQFKQAESFFSAAQKRMGLLLCRTGVLEAQCFFLAGVYLMATLRPMEAWKMFVQALACCQAFYTEKESPDADKEGEQRLRESIYWTCFKSELELRLELNVSETSIWDLTYPAFFPSPPDGLRSQREIVWYFYLAEIALRRLGNRILNYIYDTKTKMGSSLADMADSTQGFEQQAADWLRSLPQALDLDSPSVGEESERELHHSLKFILKGHLLDCYEMMYWPFIVVAVRYDKPEQTATITKAMLDSFIQKALVVCVDRIEKNEQGFYYRHHGTWLMLRSCTRSAFVLLAAARLEKLTLLMPERWRLAVERVLDMLRFWRRESRDVEDRLRLIEALLDGVTYGGPRVR